MRSLRSASSLPRRHRPLFVERLEDRVVPAFVAPLAFDAGNSPVAVAAGDFTGTGVLDLAVVNDTSPGAVTVLLGNGDGTFHRGESFAVGNRPQSVAVGDFTHDGHLDLAVANYFSNTVSVLLGNGDGTFQPARNFATASGPRSVAVGDLRHDGHLDLVTANYFSNTVSVLLGNGDGTFQPPQNIAVGVTGQSPSSVALGDFTGNGILDICLLYTSPSPRD